MDLRQKLAIVIPTTVTAVGIIIGGSVFGVGNHKTNSFNPKDWSCYGDAKSLCAKLEKYNHRDQADANVAKAMKAFEDFIKNKGKGIFRCSYKVAGNTVTYDFDYSSEKPKKSCGKEVNVLIGYQAVRKFMELYGNEIENNLAIPKLAPGVATSGVPVAPPAAPVPPLDFSAPPPPPPSPVAPPKVGLDPKSIKKGDGSVATDGKKAPAPGGFVPGPADLTGVHLRKVDPSAPAPAPAQGGVPNQKKGDTPGQGSLAAAAVAQRKKLNKGGAAAPVNNDFPKIKRQAFENKMDEIKKAGQIPVLKMCKVGKGKKQQFKLVLTGKTADVGKEFCLYQDTNQMSELSHTVHGVTFKCERLNLLGTTVFEKQ